MTPSRAGAADLILLYVLMALNAAALILLPVAAWRIVGFIRASGRFPPFVIPILILGVFLFEVVLLLRLRGMKRRLSAMKEMGDPTRP